MNYPDSRILVDGRWLETGQGINVINPSSEEVIGRVLTASVDDLENAVRAARRAQSGWYAMGPAKRAAIMLRAVAILKDRVDAIAEAITLEHGKVLALAKAEVLRSCDMLEWDANEGCRQYGRLIPAEAGMTRLVTREPFGVVAAITPWNLPLSSAARKIGGALAAGCTMVLKPSEETPAGAVLLAEAFVEAGLPAGVLNLVFGEPAPISEFLIAHDDVDFLSFTGSVGVGKRLTALAAAAMKPTLMELGGHAPVIVCGDADPVRSGQESAVSKSRNTGQLCVSPTRFFVDRAIYDEFVDAFVKKAQSIVVGDGLSASSQMGPLANRRRLEAIDELVRDATSKGATLRAGGQRIGNKGYFYPVTVLTDVPASARVLREEPFGPLAIINPTDDLDHALRESNALRYGLAGYAYTNDASNIERIRLELQCGNIGINQLTASVAETPFGGIRDSGFGREGGIEGLQGYTYAKTVSLLQNTNG